MGYGGGAAGLVVIRYSGGLRRVDERDPSYLPSAGNDYFFASAQGTRPLRDEAILVPGPGDGFAADLRQRQAEDRLAGDVDDRRALHVDRAA